MHALTEVAAWSAWMPFASVVRTAPKEPGVYLARQDDEVLYVGMAGPRDRGGKATPKGLRGRLADVEEGRPGTPRDWGRAAFQRADLQVCWAVTADRDARQIWSDA